MKWWLVLLAACCIAGAFAGHRAGWKRALASPEVAEAFSVFHSRPAPQSLVGNSEAKIDIGTALETTIPAVIEAMKARDMETFSSGMRQLEMLDADQLEELLRQIDPDDQQALQGIFELLAMREPARAFALISELLPEQRASGMHHIAVQRWAKVDPQAAWNAVREWSGESETRGPPAVLEEMVLRGWAEKDLDGALAAWSELPDNLKGNAFGGITRGRTTADSRERVLDFLAEQPPGKGRAWAYGSIIQDWVDKTSFGEVTAWIDSQADAGNFSPGEIADLERKAAFVQVQARPRETADWLMARSNEGRRSEDLERLIHAWSITHPNSAGEWLREQELGPESDAAVWRFAMTIRDDDPESAFHWAREIRAPDLRQRITRQVLARWKELDLNDAERFLAGGNLSDEEMSWIR